MRQYCHRDDTPNASRDILTAPVSQSLVPSCTVLAMRSPRFHATHPSILHTSPDAAPPAGSSTCICDDAKRRIPTCGERRIPMAIAVDPVLSQNEFHKTVTQWGTPDAPHCASSSQWRRGSEDPVRRSPGLASGARMTTLRYWIAVRDMRTLG